MNEPHLSVQMFLPDDAQLYGSYEYERAVEAYKHALRLENTALRHEHEYGLLPTRRWLEIADAWEVFTDAAEEAGLTDVRQQICQRTEQILDRIRSAYAPRAPADCLTR